MLDTKVGADEHKADPADVAKTGFEAMEKGEPGVVAGASNKLRQALANIMPTWCWPSSTARWRSLAPRATTNYFPLQAHRLRPTASGRRRPWR